SSRARSRAALRSSSHRPPAWIDLRSEETKMSGKLRKSSARCRFSNCASSVSLEIWLMKIPGFAITAPRRSLEMQDERDRNRQEMKPARPDSLGQSYNTVLRWRRQVSLAAGSAPPGRRRWDADRIDAVTAHPDSLRAVRGVVCEGQRRLSLFGRGGREDDIDDTTFLRAERRAGAGVLAQGEVLLV